MPTLAEYKDCTGCCACQQVCPRQCITMEEDGIGAIIPHINTSKCIDCKACEKICPAINPVTFNKPIKAYAAWNNNDSQRKVSASGGIATAVYMWALNNNGVSVGATTNEDWSISISLLDKSSDIPKFQNSKYSYSNPANIFNKIKGLLHSDKIIVLIGLPCQIAGYRKYFGDLPQIYYLDLVCHGVCPNSYLKQHIAHIEASLNIKCSRISFRAPEKGTQNYFFTVYDKNGDISYSKRSCDGDLYNIAFHRSYSYRENCYHCHYAKPDRCSDMTIGDYHGLGTQQPCDYSDENVSVILVNTAKGNILVRELIHNNLITAHERLVTEPLNGDLQLQHPSIKKRERLIFEKQIKKQNGDFIKTINYVLLKQKHYIFISKLLSLPKLIIQKFKHICRI